MNLITLVNPPLIIVDGLKQQECDCDPCLNYGTMCLDFDIDFKSFSYFKAHKDCANVSCEMIDDIESYYQHVSHLLLVSDNEEEMEMGDQEIYDRIRLYISGLTGEKGDTS